MSKISYTTNFQGIFCDKRLDKRGDIIGSAVINSKGSSINSITKDEAEQKGMYRFLDNDEVNERKLIKELTYRCGLNVQDRDVLVLADTSNIGLSKHVNHLKPASGLGLVGNKLGTGFLAHCSLVIDANNKTMLGFSDVHLWHREENKSNNTTRIYKKQFIEEKESFRWI